MDELPKEVAESARKCAKLADERAEKCKERREYIKEIGKIRSQHEIMIMQMDASVKLLQVISQQLNIGMFSLALLMSLFLVAEAFVEYGF